MERKKIKPPHPNRLDISTEYLLAIWSIGPTLLGSLQSLHKGIPTAGTEALIEITGNFGYKNIGSLVAQFVNQIL